MIRILAVRHGESDWNVSGRVQGQADGPELTPAGREQAAAAAEGLAVRGATRLISSDQCRARRTADIIGGRLGLPVETDVALREQFLGDMEGRLRGELRALPTPEGEHINEIRWGGGESIEDLHGRVSALVSRLRAEADGRTVIVVTHAGTMQVLQAIAGGRGHREVEWGRIGNAEVLELSF